MSNHTPHVGLFIPCYVDQFYPNVGIASLELLEKLGCKVSYPQNQTCCGQPLANSGYERDTIGSSEHFIKTFGEFDYVVAPSGSCIMHVKEHFPPEFHDQNAYKELQGKVYELTEFITDILKAEIKGKFPHRIGFHSSCHGLRGLRLAASTELNVSPFNKAKQLLQGLDGLDWVELTRKDECCGFGGTFAVSEEALSVQMGKDRLADHLEKDVEILTGGDMSCIMHLQGISSRNKQPLKFMHIAEILNQAIQ